MSEKVEWEIVDDAPRRNSGAWQSASGPTGPNAAYGHPLQALLGRWWRWKVAGVALVAVCLLTLVAIFAGVFVLAAAAGVLLSLAVAKARRLFGRPGGTVAPR